MRRLYVGFLCLSMMLLMSCGWYGKPAAVSEPAKLPYKVAGATDAAVIEFQNRFDKQGVKVITLGQNYLVSIPSGALFFDESPRLTWNSYELLNDVACYLKQFRKISVNITAYSSKCVSPQRERALTMARARAVADYLWSQNIDGRFIFTHGLGSDKPIVRYLQGGDGSPNSRVEITFRNAVA